MKSFTPMKKIVLDTKNVQHFSSIYSPKTPKNDSILVTNSIVSPTTSIAVGSSTNQRFGVSSNHGDVFIQEMTARKHKSKVPPPRRPSTPKKPGQVHSATH